MSATSVGPGPAAPATTRWGWVRRAMTSLVVIGVAAIGGTAGWLAVGDDATAEDLTAALADHAIEARRDGPLLTIAPTGASVSES